MGAVAATCGWLESDLQLALRLNPTQKKDSRELGLGAAPEPHAHKKG